MARRAIPLPLTEVKSVGKAKELPKPPFLKTRPRKSARSPSRDGKRSASVYLDASDFVRIKTFLAAENRSWQGLLIEALNDVLRKNGQYPLMANGEDTLPP